jgi:hypothetical protein
VNYLNGQSDDRWQHLPAGKYEKGKLASAVFAYVGEVERDQSYLFERFMRLAALYDPYFARTYGMGHGDSPGLRVEENVIASNVDTVVAAIAPSQVRPRFLTDDGDFEDKRQAARLSWYAEGIGKLLNMAPSCVEAFKDAALKGTGLVKVWPDFAAGKIRAETTLVDNIIVDEKACRKGSPRQLHERRFVDRAELIAEYPTEAEAIERAQQSLGEGSGAWDIWAGYRSLERHEVVVIESWQLPRGKKLGRHTICVDGCELLDEEWRHEHFPFAVFRWTTRAIGWYGIGGAERIAGHQRRLNKMHWQVDRQLDQHAMPSTYVHQADAALAVKSRNEFGTIGVYKVAIPKTVIPQAVSGETYQRLERVKEGSYEEFGVSRMAATAHKPAGIDSGVALREYRDQTTQRFSMQELGFEQLNLDVFWLAIAAAKELAAAGIEPPVVIKKLARGRKKIRWADVDITEARVQLYAAATLNRTPSGRQQTVLEFAQAGVFSLDEARRLLGSFDSLDLDSTLSVYQAAIDSIEMTIEEILEGGSVVPEPYENLELGIRIMQSAYLRARVDGAGDDILDNMRTWIDLAADMLAPPEPPPVDPMMDPAMAGAPPMDPAAAALPMPGEMPTATPASQLAVNMIPGAEAL